VTYASKIKALPCAFARGAYTAWTMPSPPTSAAASGDTLARRLIIMRHQGASWDACATELGRSAAALNIVARRLRDRGEWKLANGREARGAPRVGERGRPRNAIPSTPVSLRFAPDVATALRTVSRCAGKREGEVVAEAMRRAVARRAERRVSRKPLDLEPGERFELCDGLRTETVAVNVPQPLFDAFIKLHDSSEYPMSLISDAVHRLLHDLNYRLVDCSATDPSP
jgi:hypothetical protein